VLRSAGVVIADAPPEAPWEPLLDLIPADTGGPS
jgi:hypothetical protein